MQKIKIPNTEGKNISANVYTPTEPTKKLAILCPGYLHSKDYAHLKTLAEEFQVKGYSVVTFDPVGTWESDGSIFDYTITGYLNDIKTVLDYMWENGKYEDVVLGGHSRGGAVSLIFATEDTRISRVLSIMPSPLNILPEERYKNWREKGMELSIQNMPDSSNRKEFMVPFSYTEDRAKYNVLEYAKKIKVPVSVGWAETDNQVSFQDIQNIYDAISAPKKLLKFLPNHILIGKKLII